MGSVSYGLGADLSLPPSLPVGDDRYLNLSSQKRPTGRNLGGNRLVRRSGTTSRGAVVLRFVFAFLSCVLFAHAQLFSNSTSYHICGNEMNCLGSSENMTVARHLLVPATLTCGRISRLVGGSELRSPNRPFCLTIAFAKCPKQTIFRHFVFLHCSNQIQDNQ